MLEHFHHSCFALYRWDQISHRVFDVDVVFEIVGLLDAFLSALFLQAAGEIPVSTSHKCEVFGVQVRQAPDPLIKSLQSLLQIHLPIDHLLGNASQLSAELGELGVERWGNIVMELIDDFPLLQIDHHDWKLDDFTAWLQLHIIFASGLEIKDQQILQFLRCCHSRNLIEYFVHLFAERPEFIHLG